jgi:sugar phosphate isomerase/epimerase
MLDAWHYFRSGPDGALLRSIPGASILGVQLCDAPATPEPEPLHATLHERLLPGEGSFALPTLLADLGATGTSAPVGVEVFSDALHALPPEEAGRLAGQALRAVRGPG